MVGARTLILGSECGANRFQVLLFVRELVADVGLEDERAEDFVAAGA